MILSQEISSRSDEIGFVGHMQKQKNNIQLTISDKYVFNYLYDLYFSILNKNNVVKTPTLDRRKL